MAVPLPVQPCQKYGIPRGKFRFFGPNFRVSELVTKFFFWDFLSVLHRPPPLPSEVTKKCVFVHEIRRKKLRNPLSAKDRTIFSVQLKDPMPKNKWAIYSQGVQIINIQLLRRISWGPTLYFVLNAKNQINQRKSFLENNTLLNARSLFFTLFYKRKTTWCM